MRNFLVLAFCFSLALAETTPDSFKDANDSIDEEVLKQFASTPDKPLAPIPKPASEDSQFESQLIEDSTEIRLNKRFVIRSQVMRFTVEAPESNQNFFYYFKVRGTGKMSVLFYTDKDTQNHFLKTNIALFSSESDILVPIDAFAFGFKQGYIIEVKNEGKSQDHFDFSLNRGDRLEMNFNGKMKVMTRLCGKFAVKVSQESGKFSADKNYRLQFIVQSSMDKQRLTGFEKLEMLINKGSKIPTETDHDLVASGNTGIGLIKTISKNNRLYCIGSSCEYTFRLTASDVDYVYLLPTVIEDNSVISFDHYLYLLEELEAGEEVVYEFHVPKYDNDWKFSMIPVEGVTDMYINPDFKPDSINDYKYKSVSENPENIIVTAFEAKKFDFKFEKFFLFYRSHDPSQPSVFKFEINRLQVDSPHYVKEGVVETGVVALDEVINYHFDLKTPRPQTFVFNLNLRSFSGNADFYLKECLPSEDMCKVTEEDIQRVRGGELEKLSKDRIFRYSAVDAVDPKTPKEDVIFLEFKCGMAKSRSDNAYPTSETCLFAIGIHCRDSKNPFGAFYRFDVKGQDIHNVMDFSGSHMLTINREQTLSYQFDLSNLNRESQTRAGFRIVTLTGKAKVFFSKTNPYPNESDNELMLSINDASFTALHSTETDGAVSLFEDGSNPPYLYLTIDAASYTIMDIYPFLYSAQNEMVEIQEPAQFNKVMHRKLNFDDIVDVKGKAFHMQNFLITIPDTSGFDQPMVIHLNSDVMGLILCVQLDVVLFDKEKPCDFTTDTEVLNIPAATLEHFKGKKIGLSVQKEIKNGKPEKANIDFSITIAIRDYYDELAIHTPGRSFSYTSSPPNRVVVTVNLSQMKRTGLVTLYSDDPLIYATVYTGGTTQDHVVDTLDKFKFGFKITNGVEFKKRFCEVDCLLSIEVFSGSDHSARFTITFTVDDIPILLKEDSMITLPSSQHHRLVYEPPESDLPIGFNTQCETTSIVAYASIYKTVSVSEKKLKDIINENKFDFKTNIEIQNQIIVPADMLKKSGAQAIFYFLVPKFDIENPTIVQDIFEFYHLSDKTRIDIHSRLTKLEPYKHLSGTVSKGDFNYYHFSLDKRQDFTIMLSVLSGEADLYINQGMYNLTSTKMHWKKAVNHRSDEIVIKQKDYEMQLGPISFNIGVYGRDNAKYSVMVVPEFKNLISVHFQHLIEMDLAKGEFYYFDFITNHAKYNTLIFAENSDIQISALEFDEKNMNTDFLYLIEEESNYIQTFTFHKGDVPRKNLVDNVVKLKSHVIIRMKAVQEDAHLNFVIFDALKPINVFTEKRFFFVQEKDDCYVFQMNLGGEYESVDVDLKLAFGAVEVWITDIENHFTNSTKIDSPGQKYFSYTIDRKKRATDIVIFGKLFIKVKSSEFSKYSLYAKPKNKFKEIHEYETEIIYPNPDRDQFIFYYISEKKLSSVQSFSIFLEFVNYYGDKPELYFNSNTDLTVDEGSKLISMPLIDYIERGKGDFKQLEIKPEILSGYFVIKINQSSSIQLPIKVSVSINHHRNIEVNGLYKGSLPVEGVKHTYSMYIPSAGELRILAESCTNIAPSTAVYASKHNTTTIRFEDQYNQGFPYISFDDTSATKERNYKVLSLPIRRALIAHPGVLRFEVAKSKEVDEDISGFDNHYYLLTEFKPQEKNLFFKDYVQLWDEDEKSNQKKFSYNFADENRALHITANIPGFKQQLALDYPSLKKISVRFYFDLFADDDFEKKLNRCGFEALRNSQSVHKTAERTIDIRGVTEKLQELPAEVVFDSVDVAKFKDKPNLSVFCSLSITFFDNENEQFHVTLNLKFASVPYFLMKTVNKAKPLTTISNIFFVIVFVAVIILLLVIFFYIAAKGEPETKKKYAYSEAGEGSSRLEMSAKTTN